MAEQVDTIIIGTGFGGLGMAAQMREAGRDDFLILEKASGVGGTWRENTYPGAECDVASALYSYSFHPNPTWDFKWAKQAQILQYLEDFTTDRGLRPHIRFGRTVEACTYDADAKRWTVTTAEGETYDARFVVSALGQLHHPNIPDFKGLDDYAGATFHSARWDHSVDYAGKRVGVVGCAASALQLIPEVAETAAQVTVYQRTPNWVIPKFDRPYSRFEKGVARVFPGIAKAYRAFLWSLGEYVIWPMIKGTLVHRRLGEWSTRRFVKQHIDDPELREALIPDYPIGAKRILLSDRYYPALARANVEVVRDPIETFTADGVTAGEARKHDIVVFATGFQTNPFLQSLDVTGEDGRVLADHWRDGAHAYLGVATAGFPNLFILYGPNTNTGHTSIVYKLEAQFGYVLQLMDAAGQGAVSVKPEVEDAFNAEIQSRLAGLAWNKVEASWYKDGGRITNNWPGSSLEYKRRMKTPDMDAFEVTA